MSIPKISIRLKQIHLIKTNKDQTYRFGQVTLVRMSLFNKRLTPFDSRTGELITAWKHYNQEDDKYYEVNMTTIKQRKLFKSGYFVNFIISD